MQATKISSKSHMKHVRAAISMRFAASAYKTHRNYVGRTSEKQVRAAITMRFSTPKLKNCNFEAFLIKNLNRKCKLRKSRKSNTWSTCAHAIYNEICSKRLQNTMKLRRQKLWEARACSHYNAICSRRLQNTMKLRRASSQKQLPKPDLDAKAAKLQFRSFSY